MTIPEPKHMSEIDKARVLEVLAIAAIAHPDNLELLQIVRGHFMAEDIERQIRQELEAKLAGIRAYIEDNRDCTDDLQCYKVADQLRAILGDET